MQHLKIIIFAALVLLTFDTSAQTSPENLIIHLKNGEVSKCPISAIESIIFDNDGENPDTPVTTSWVMTGSAEPRAFSATITGIYSGNKMPTTIGCQYSYDKNFPIGQTRECATEGKFGGVEFKATGLVDQVKVYYRVYAIVDKEYYYGETKSFETLQGTYTIDGETYKFIKVTGLPTGSFSMMQTELPPNAEVTIEGESIGCWSGNYNSTMVTSGESRGFFEKFSHVAVVPRYPTPEEWMYAASGGTLTNDYKYSGSNDIDDVAWYMGNSIGNVRKPAQKEPNELGFYDMSGNYAECCSSYDEDQLKDIIELYIKRFVQTLQKVTALYYDTSWKAKGGAFGGNWNSEASKCQVSSFENYTDPSTKNFINGDIYSTRLVYSRPD